MRGILTAPLHFIGFGFLILLISILIGCEPHTAPNGEINVTQANVSPIPAYSKFNKSRYTRRMVDLGSLGGTTWAEASSINDKGQITGFSATSNPDEHFHAFVWENGRMDDLGIPASYNIALSINDTGQIVGMYLQNQDLAYLWEDGTMVELGTLGWQGTTAKAINDKGQIVGYSHTHPSAGNYKHAFLWENGEMIDLGTLGGTYSEAIAINDRGQIIGYSTTSTGEMKSFLLKKETMQNLGAFTAAALNDNGEIAGYITGSSGKRHIAIWKNGKTNDLGPLSLGGDSNNTVINSISNDRLIVGASTTAAGETHAFLWTHGQMIDLGTLGGDHSEASSVNNKGQVVGSSLTAEGERHAILWDTNEESEPLAHIDSRRPGRE